MRVIVATVLVMSVLASAGGSARAQPAAPDTGPVEDAGDAAIGKYLAELERTRRLPPEDASLATVRARVVEAEDALVRGDARAATSLLYALVESPRHHPWRSSPSFANAEFLLGRALLRGGAYRSAERYLLRVMARGPTGLYFVPAFRALVDLALETRDYARLGPILSEQVAGGASLPPDSASELDYLRGRIAYANQDHDRAQIHFAAVGRTSRLYGSAAYLRGLLAARKQRFDDAQKAFCEIADQRDQDTLSFYVDDRYFTLKDLARLALGRIAHERDRYDEAYYFYFSVPEESDRLAEALFEAAWSMYQKGEHTAARAFAAEFDELFPRSPLRAEVAILKANLDLKSCRFVGALDGIRALAATYQPLADELTAILGDPARRRALVDRLLAQPASMPVGDDVEGRLVTLLKLDARFGGLHAAIHGLDADLAEATAGVAAWRALGGAAAARDQVLPAASSPAAGQLLAEVEALLPAASDDRALGQKVGELLLAASLVAHPPASAGPYAAEAGADEALARRLFGLRERMVEAAHALAGQSLLELDRRLRSLLRQARLVAIDAVVGRKKKLEIEIAGLYAGKIPPELYFKMRAEGTLGDDEEYWPFEGEHWADEYTNYK